MANHGTKEKASWFHDLSMVAAGVLAAAFVWQAAPAQEPEATYSPDGAQSCLDCHGPSDEHPATEILKTPHALSADARTPFGESSHDCESCHGPSRAHLSRLPDGSRPPVDFSFDAGRSPEEKNAVCLDCHTGGERIHWASSTHNREELACTDCHTVHAEKDPVLVVEQQPQVCFDCHQAQRVQLMQRSAHPVRDGLLACTDCHAPHGSSGPAQLTKLTVNETCYDCHAEKRGPFLWEHAPVREDCTNCHTPHGSVHENLLTARTPWLCQQCHLAQFHPSTAYSGTGVPPAGAAQQLLLKSCMNCHGQVHGSNHPSGERWTR